MKLLAKTNRTYLLISAIAFIIAGLVIYFVLSFIFEDQLNEQLKSDIKGIKQSIEKDGKLPSYFPFIEVREVKGEERSFISIDTIIYYNSQKEIIPFRQISRVVSINWKTYFIAARDPLLGSVFVLLLVSLYFINRKLSINIWRPFYKTLDELKEFSHDKPGFRLSSVSNMDEFMELNKTLDKLTRKVITDYQALKRFTEDASHEIQTPLAVIQSKLETMLQYPDLKQEQAELINSAYTYSLRISKLTQTLLLLTKIANDQFPEKRAVYLSDLLIEKIEFFEDHIIGKSLILKKNIEPECYIDTNFFLADSLIINLMGNAVKHSMSNGLFNISLNRNYLEISNSGKPFSFPPEKLFDRFYKTDKSSDSPGLGLAIVKEICLLNKWEISYKYEDDLHKFIVTF